jgi:hypothetical protein
MLYRLLLVVLGSSLTVSQSWAATITFSDRPSWSTQTRPGVPITFAGLAEPGESVSFLTSAGLTVQGVTFVGTSLSYQCVWSTCSDSPVQYGLAVFGWDGSSPDGGETAGILAGPQTRMGWSAGGWGFPPSSDGEIGTLSISLPLGVRAFGADFTTKLGTAFPARFSIFTARGLDRSFLLTDGFAGFVSDSDISQIDITQYTSSFDFNQVYLANVTVGSAVPEPATLAMSGCCFVVLALARAIVRKQGRRL